MAIPRTKEDWDLFRSLMAQDTGIGEPDDLLKAILAQPFLTEDDMALEREQKLVDLGFELALAAYAWNKDNPDVTPDQVAAWVRNAFRECGFNVGEPVGQSWGVIDKTTPYVKKTDGK